MLFCFWPLNVVVRFVFLVCFVFPPIKVVMPFLLNIADIDLIVSLCLLIDEIDVLGVCVLFLT